MNAVDVCLTPGLRRAMETGHLAGDSLLQRRLQRCCGAARPKWLSALPWPLRPAAAPAAVQFSYERLRIGERGAWEDNVLWLAEVTVARAEARTEGRALAWPVGFDAGMRGVVAREVLDVSVEELQALAAAVAEDLAEAGYAWTIRTHADGGFDSIWTRADGGAWSEFGAPSGLAGGLLLEPRRGTDPGGHEYLRLATLLQMVWTDHPVNHARARNGRPVIDGVHVWAPVRSGEPPAGGAGAVPHRRCGIRLRTANADSAFLTRATLRMLVDALNAAPEGAMSPDGENCHGIDALRLAVDDRFLRADDEVETLQALSDWLEQADTAGLFWDSQARAGLMPRPSRGWLRMPGSKGQGWIPG